MWEGGREKGEHTGTVVDLDFEGFLRAGGIGELRLG